MPVPGDGVMSMRATPARNVLSRGPNRSVVLAAGIPNRSVVLAAGIVYRTGVGPLEQAAIAQSAAPTTPRETVLAAPEAKRRFRKRGKP